MPDNTSMPWIAPSLLSADFSNLERELEKVGEAGYLHLDIMDGQFVPNISFGPVLIKKLRKRSEAIFDTHLMIAQPDRYLDDFIEAGCDIITVHQEACTHLHRTVDYIKKKGVRAGVSLNPATPLSTVEEILPDLDLLLIMSVNPGFGGQTFIPSSLDKLRRAKAAIDRIRAEQGREVLLEVDGGVNLQTIDQVVECGPDLIVAGSAVFKGDARKNFRELSKHL